MDRLRTELVEQILARPARVTRTHAGSTVVTRVFQRALERASGRDLDPLFDEWAYLGHSRK
jgi:aminopeptidase N